ncbi:hypothetical protein ACFPVX_23095 [Cohnella faecalis]|nr:hypothetical protein [Cohnella faecalis]
MVKTLYKNIEWITKLDKLYSDQLNGMNNSNYLYYPDIELDLITENIFIIFQKSNRKTKIIFGDKYGRRAYLSDVDIINMIRDAEDTVYGIFCEILTLFVMEPETNDIHFKINEESFYYKSIVKNSYEPSKLEILRLNFFDSAADIKISYLDLLTLINLVITKEYLVDSSRSDIRVLRQAKKFLILSKFYKEKLYQEELERFEFDTSQAIEYVYKNNKIAKKIDELFDKITI